LATCGDGRKERQAFDQGAGSPSSRHEAVPTDGPLEPNYSIYEIVDGSRRAATRN
jgi:hypothetical protein